MTGDLARAALLAAIVTGCSSPDSSSELPAIDAGALPDDGGFEAAPAPDACAPMVPPTICNEYAVRTHTAPTPTELAPACAEAASLGCFGYSLDVGGPWAWCCP